MYKKKRKTKTKTENATTEICEHIEHNLQILFNETRDFTQLQKNM